MAVRQTIQAAKSLAVAGIAEAAVEPEPQVASLDFAHKNQAGPRLAAGTAEVVAVPAAAGVAAVAESYYLAA